jgi:STI1 domain
MRPASRLRIALRYARVWKKSRLLRVRVRLSLAPLCICPHEVYDYTAADERGDGAEAMGLGKMFNDPGMFAKLAANPRTAKHLADASFMQKVCALYARLQRSSRLTVSPSSYNLCSRIPNWLRA